MVERFKPDGGSDLWNNKIAPLFNEKFPEMQREGVQLRQKYNDLRNRKPPTGDPNVPKLVKHAKQIAWIISRDGGAESSLWEASDEQANPISVDQAAKDNNDNLTGDVLLKESDGEVCDGESLSLAHGTRRHASATAHPFGTSSKRRRGNNGGDISIAQIMFQQTNEDRNQRAAEMELQRHKMELQTLQLKNLYEQQSRQIEASNKRMEQLVGGLMTALPAIVNKFFPSAENPTSMAAHPTTAVDDQNKGDILERSVKIEQTSQRYEEERENCLRYLSQTIHRRSEEDNKKRRWELLCDRKGWDKRMTPPEDCSLSDGQMQKLQDCFMDLTKEDDNNNIGSDVDDDNLADEAEKHREVDQETGPVDGCGGKEVSLQTDSNKEE